MPHRDYAARIRAAHAYSGLTKGDLASAIGMSPRNLTRYESGERGSDRELREQIADACGVPAAFMELGFAPLAQPITDADRRIYLIEQRIGEIQESVRPERLIETFRPLLERAGPGAPREPSKPRTSRRAKGHRPAAGEAGGT